MKKLVWLGAILVIPVLGQDSIRKDKLPPIDRTAKLVVHEWGVAACAAGADQTLIGASGPADDDLPQFVTQLKTLTMSGGASVRQPIVYFYSDKPTGFSASVQFPKGYPTCFYPAASSYANTADWKTPGKGNLGWVGALDPATKRPSPTVPKDHWIEKCRDVDAAQIMVGGGSEKFLFYEGVTKLECPLKVSGDVQVTSASAWTSPSVVIRVRDGKSEMFPVEALSKKLTPGSVDLSKMLMDAGLYEKEARALLGIWEAHFTKREGLRVITLITGSGYDALFPLDVCPKPVEVKRVLVLCVEFPSPELETKVQRLVEQLRADDAKEREKASKEIQDLGPVATSILAKFSDDGDPEVRAHVRAILAKWSQSSIPVPVPGSVRRCCSKE